MNHTSGKLDYSNNVDGVLRDYFQAQMPTPWPDCPVPEPHFLRSTRWLGANLRWSVAASVALFLAGYLALAGMFPRETSRNGLDRSRDFGHRPLPKTMKKL